MHVVFLNRLVMESYNSSIDSDTFWFNFLSLRNSWKDDIPLDTFIFHCKQCNEKLVMNSDGVILLNESLEEPIKEFMDTLETFFIEDHISCSETCTGNQIDFSEDFGPPVNIVILLPPTENRFLTSFTIKNAQYEVQIAVQSKEDINKSIIVIYKLTSSADSLYLDFIKDNFHEHLNLNLDVDESSNIGVEDRMIDEETVSAFRHLIPRLYGGGRKLDQHYNYYCYWCPKDQIKNTQRGKFVELKNYRKHFRTAHPDIDYAEFLRKVPNRDPKWCCPNCRRFMSISNSVRHRAICNVSDDEDDSDDSEEGSHEDQEVPDNVDDEGGEEEEEGEEEIVAPTTSQITAQKLPKVIEKHVDISERSGRSSNQNVSKSPHDARIDEDGRNAVSNIDEEAAINLHQKAASIEKDDAEDPHNSQQQKAASKEDRVMHTHRGNVYSFSSNDESMEEIQKYVSKKKRNIQTPKHNKSVKVPVIDPSLVNIVSPSIKKILKKTAEGKYRVVEKNNNETEKLQVNKPEFSIRDEFNCTSETDTESEKDHEDDNQTKNKSSLGDKWWTHSKREYLDRGYHGMDIFVKTDTEEFVQRVIQNWKTHQANKIILDRQMEEIENSDLSLNQFSVTRDQPILEDYSKFIQSCSTKDVLSLFSADYDENSVQSGAKASTAKSYEKRIMELFTFLAKKYDKFHLDWCVDYCGEIEKVLSKGERTFEIFVLTKEDLNEFVAKFKYGNNPAANVNVRIFAVKKFLEFLVQNYKDNEDKFAGSIVQKSKLVECLEKRLSDINKGLAPHGAIKAISVASNKNHKAILLEQMKKCPEKSLENIMKGVAAYLQSEEYSDMKAMMYEFAYKKTKIPSRNEYMLLTNWLLEMLICVGGNRPCALLGITIGRYEY